MVSTCINIYDSLVVIGAIRIKIRHRACKLSVHCNRGRPFITKTEEDIDAKVEVWWRRRAGTTAQWLASTTCRVCERWRCFGCKPADAPG